MTAGAIILTGGAGVPALAAGETALYPDASGRLMTATADGVTLPASGEYQKVAVAASVPLTRAEHAGRLVECSGTLTLTVPAAASFGAYGCKIVNIGGGTVTLAGAVSYSLAAGKTVDLVSTGAAWSASGATVTDDPAALKQGRHTIFIPAAAMTARITNGPSVGITETATYKVMRRTFDFDAAIQELVQFVVAMPKSWNEGTITFQVLWTAASGSGAAVWGMQGLACGDGDALDATFGTGVLVTDTLLSAGAVHISPESAAVTIAGPPVEGDVVVFQLYRAAADAADTLAVDALLLGVRVFYTVNAGNDA